MREGESADMRLYDQGLDGEKSLRGCLSFVLTELAPGGSYSVSRSHYEASKFSHGIQRVRNAGYSLIDSPGFGLADTGCWVDRSQYIPVFVSREQSVFLRPPRMGKTTFLDTMAEFFLTPDEFLDDRFLISKMAFRAEQQSGPPLVWNPANREKFGAHYFPPCPVAKFNFSCLVGDTPVEAEESLKRMIKRVYEDAISTLDTRSPDGPERARQRAAKGRLTIDISKNHVACLTDLIRWLSEESLTGWIVILVDEYDSFLNKERKSELFGFIRDLHGNFYQCFKTRSQKILCAVVTGITRWSFDSLLCGANQLYDMTLDGLVADICGLTEDEVEEIVRKQYPNEVGVMDILRRNLNLYRFSPDSNTRVFSPHYVMLATIDDGVSGPTKRRALHFCHSDGRNEEETAESLWAQRMERVWWQFSASVSKMVDHVTTRLRIPIKMLARDLMLDGAATAEGVAAKLFFHGFCTITNTRRVSAGSWGGLEATGSGTEITGVGTEITTSGTEMTETEITLDFPNKMIKDLVRSHLLNVLSDRGVRVPEFSWIATALSVALACSPTDWLQFFAQFNCMLRSSNPEVKENRTEEHYRSLLVILSMFCRNLDPVTEEPCGYDTCDTRQDISDIRQDISDIRQEISDAQFCPQGSQAVLELKVADYFPENKKMTPATKKAAECGIAVSRPTERAETIVEKGTLIAFSAVQQIRKSNYSLTIRPLHRVTWSCGIYRIGVVVDKTTGLIHLVQFEGGLQYLVSVDEKGNPALAPMYLGHEFYSARLYSAPNPVLNVHRNVLEGHEFNLLSFMMADVEDYRAAGIVFCPVIVTLISEVHETLPPVGAIANCRKLHGRDTRSVVVDFVAGMEHVEFLMTWLADLNAGREQSNTSRNGNPVSLGLRLAFKAVQFFHKKLGS